MLSSRTKIILALDDLSLEESIDLVSRVGERCYAVKKHDILGAEGERTVRSLLMLPPKRVCIDRKIHDIPRSAAAQAARILAYGARIITVNAGTGLESMRAVAGEICQHPDALALASLLHTGLSEKEIERIHGGDRTHNNILYDLAYSVLEAGLGGIVASPREVGMLKKHSDFKDMLFMAVSIHSKNADILDQKRFGTPQEAVDNGADLLVIGSEVTKAKNPVAAFNQFAVELNGRTRPDSWDTVTQSLALH